MTARRSATLVLSTLLDRRPATVLAVVLVLLLGAAAHAAAPARAQDGSVDRYPLQQDSLWGYIDGGGDWVIEPRYPGALPFTEGLAGVQDPETGAWGFIGPDGDWVIEPRFGGGPYASYQRSVDPFSDGLAPVRLGTPQEPRLGMIDRDGAVVFQGQYEELHGFSEGLARAETETGYGYLDRSGAWVIEPQYHEAHDFSEGLAAVAREFGDDLGYIDPTGNWVLEPAYRDAGPFVEGRAPVQRDFDDFYIDRTGRAVIEGPFDRVRPFREGLALAQPEDSSGFVFLDPDGAVVIDAVDGRPICFGLGYQNGLARVWVAADGQECGGFSVMGELPLPEQVEVSNALLAYIDRTGEPVYMESAAALMAARAREDSIRAARRAAEEAEAAARSEAERERLAACPDRAVYGDSTLPSWIEVGNAGKAVRFYFEDAAVRMRSAREFDIIPPAFEKQGAMMGIQLQTLRVEPDFFEPSRLTAEINGYGASRAFCLALPDAVTDDMGSEGSARVLSRPGDDSDRLVVDLRITSDADSTDYLAGHIATSTVVMPPEEKPELDSYGTWNDRAITEAGFTYDPATDVLSYDYGRESDGGGSVYSGGGFGGFEGEPGVYRRLDRAENEVVIHRVTEYGPELVEVEIYRADVREPGEEEQRSFFAPAEPDLASYDPTDGQRVATIRSNQLQMEPSVEPVMYGDDGRVVAAADAGPGSLMPEDYRDGAAPTLAGAMPYDLAYTVTAPDAPGRRYQIAADAAAADTYRLTVDALGPAMSPEVEDAAVLYTAFTAGMEAVQSGAGVSAMRDTVAAALDALDIDYDGAALEAESPDALAQAVFQIAQANFSMQALQAAEQVGDAEAEPPMPVTVVADGDTGRPVRSERSLEMGDDVTRITIDYRNGEAVVTAENEAQGREQKAFPVPDGTLDLFQLRHALAFLPLQPGTTAVIPLFDVDASITMEVSFSTAGGGSASSAVKLEPLYSKATLTVEGPETLDTDAGPIDAWRVRAVLEGDPRQLPGVGLVMRATEAWPLEVTYWLAADAPHRVLRADYPGGARMTAER